MRRAPGDRQAAAVCGHTHVCERFAHLRCGAATRDHQCRIDYRIEYGWGLGPVFDNPERMPLVEQPPNAAAGKRSREFSGHQKGQHPVRPSERHPSLDEERGQIDLRRKAASGSCVARTSFPCRFAKHGEVLS